MLPGNTLSDTPAHYWNKVRSSCEGEQLACIPAVKGLNCPVLSDNSVFPYRLSYHETEEKAIIFSLTTSVMVYIITSMILKGCDYHGQQDK